MAVHRRRVGCDGGSKLGHLLLLSGGVVGFGLCFRGPGSGALFRSGSISLPGGADNIRRDSSGAFWLAVHPNAFAFVGHATDPEKESPSVVLRIGRDGRGAERILQAFGDPGSSFSGASGAVQHDNRLLIGTTFGNRIMDCQIDPAELREIE